MIRGSVIFMRCAALCASMMATWYDAEHGLKISILTKTSYAYDEIGRLIEKLLPNGVKQDYSYLPGGNLESMTSIDKEGILDKYFYSYDNSGLISGINRSRRDLDAVSGQYEYSYDSIGRLVQSSLNGQVKSSYEYDAFGNRTSFVEGDAQTTYKYDSLDRLIEARELNNAQAIVKTYYYDKRGNQTREFVDGLLQKTFTFDATNMLSKVVDTDKGELENQYNGLGFRVASTRPEEKIEYLCDLSRDYYNLLERTVNGETETFVYDKNVVSMSKAGNSYYYLQDELGSPMYMTGTNGAPVSSYAFDDFGRSVDPFTGKLKKSANKQSGNHAYTTEGNIIQPFAFTGYQEDEVSGLMFAQARFYDAASGSFLSEDPRKGFINKPLTINHYGYCFGNPVGFSDKNGKLPGWMEDAWDAACDVTVDAWDVACDVASDAWDTTCEVVSDVAKDTVDAVKTVGTFVAEHPMEVADTKTDDQDVTYIYRMGSGNGTNLTPRSTDVDGLSYSLTPPTSGKYTVTTIEAVNATGVLVAEQNGTNHVSVYPRDISQLDDWMASRDTANTDPYYLTVMLQSISVKMKCGE